MTAEKIKQTFIPYRRADVIEMCLLDGRLNEEEKKQFTIFCNLLMFYYHYAFHALQERLKDYFTPIDPDSGVKLFHPITEEEERQKAGEFFKDFEKLLIKANFKPLSQEELKKAFRDRSLIQLNTEVDFDSFDRYLFYYRGSKPSKTTVKRYRYFKKNIVFETLERVILLLKFKNRDYFEQKKIDIGKLNFQPGRTYIFYYKNVPKADLEIVFPNVKIGMTLKDKLLFLLPALGVGLSTFFKISGNLLLLIGFAIFMLGLTSSAEKIFGVTEDLAKRSLIPMVAALATVVIVLGGFAITQYLNYKNKWVEFLNDVTQTLFFHSISINAGVFECLIDSAEEEECKEAILAYYHLLTSEKKLTKRELDRRIEDWFAEKYGVMIDFDVEGALEKLEQLSAEIDVENQGETNAEKISVLSRNAYGTLFAQPLQNALKILDSIWDNLFQYNCFFINK
ncbi:MAG: TMEM143 family protein [Candidatus Omnitrophota bacterium]